MTKVKDCYGDVLTTTAPYIVHCVNAQGKMASGVAKAIREKYPKAYDVYIKRFNEQGLKLGEVFGASCGPHTIVHLVGQKNYGYDGELYLSYDALEKGFSTLNKRLPVGTRIAMPQIGCGLAGGHWPTVEEIIDRTLTNLSPEVYVLNDEVPWK